MKAYIHEVAGVPELVIEADNIMELREFIGAIDAQPTAGGHGYALCWEVDEEGEKWFGGASVSDYITREDGVYKWRSGGWPLKG